MARPQFIQKLQHGKILTKDNFPQFVETWNYIGNRVENLKGDADVRPDTGFINVDSTDPEHPVVRFNPAKLDEVNEMNGIEVDTCSISCVDTSEIPSLSDSTIYELYGFHDLSNTQTELSNYEFVVRHRDDSGTMKIEYLSVELSGTSKCPANFDYLTDADGRHWVRGGYVMQARRFYWANSQEITLSGLVQLSVSMSNVGGQQGVSILQGTSQLYTSNVSATFIPLWQIGANMNPIYDYRCTPVVQRWE